MNEVIQKELASMNRDLVSFMARWRRINDLFLDLTDDRPRPKCEDININQTIVEPGPVFHTLMGAKCFCPPGHGHG